MLCTIILNKDAQLKKRSGITEGPIPVRVGLFGVKGRVFDSRIFFFYFPFSLPNESGISESTTSSTTLLTSNMGKRASYDAPFKLKAIDKAVELG